MRFMTTVLLAALGAGASSLMAATPMASTSPPPAGVALAPQINAADFALFDKTLSSDAFGGRKPGTIGAERTTNWLVAQFQRMGLQPGNHGSWFQAVPADSTQLLNTDVTLDITAHGKPAKFAYRTDMMAETLQAKPQVDLKNSPVVFMGYGVDAPDYQWDDYAGLDVKGKTVIVLVNDPGWGNHDDSLFKGRTLTYYGRWTYKFEEAARKGAAACLIVHETPGAGYPWEVVVNSWSGAQDALPPDEDPAPRLKAAGWLTTQAAQRLFAKAGRNFDELKKSADIRGFKPTDLGVGMSVAFKNRIAHSSSENVLGLLPGSTHPDEVVVYSAHWDHFGKDPGLEGDQIYNGAIDNGTGIAGLLEIAEAFAHQDPPPQRSILFIADTLEEAGLLGSRWYVTHPAFPLAKTVANINMDALPIMGPAKDIAVISWGRSQLDDYIRDAAASEGRTVVPDDAPDKGFFFRSDQFNFAKLGVPVLYARTGLDLVDGGEEAGRAAYADYTANHYHKTSDNYDPDWDFRGIIQDIQAFHAVGKKLADESTFPQWKAGADFHRPDAKATPP